jgi:hypothetical protein
VAVVTAVTEVIAVTIVSVDNGDSLAVVSCKR